MDATLFQTINGLAGHNPFLDSLLTLMSVYGPLILVALSAMPWFWPGQQAVRESRQRVVLIAVLSVVVALLVNQVIIHLWVRPRPYETLHANLLLPPTHEPSFPSDHATFSFAIAFALLFVSAPLGVLGLIVAAVIAFARVYTGQHYVIDVLGGAMIGVLCAGLFWTLRNSLAPLLKPVLTFARRLGLA